MGIHPPLILATSSYTPSVRLMMLLSAIGAIIGWPLLRLSQTPTPTPFRDVSLDLIVVLGMLNMVLWPLRLVTPWPPLRMALIMIALMIWLFAVAAIVAATTPSARRWARSAAMALVVIIALGFIPWRGVAPSLVPSFPSAFGGPFEAILALATPGGAPPTVREWAAVQGAAGAALGAWAFALLVAAWRGRRCLSRLPASESPDTLAAWS